MPYIMAYYHIIWATKYRQTSITQQIETVILEAIHSKSRELGCKIHAINTAYDHIHVAVSIRPAIAASDWVRQSKGLSTHIVNREFPNLETSFLWQKGYSLHTFGYKALPFVISYVENQKERHKSNDLEAYLEYISEE